MELRKYVENAVREVIIVAVEYTQTDGTPG